MAVDKTAMLPYISFEVGKLDSEVDDSVCNTWCDVSCGAVSASSVRRGGQGEMGDSGDVVSLIVCGEGGDPARRPVSSVTMRLRHVDMEFVDGDTL
jgi:hypothetical protein